MKWYITCHPPAAKYFFIQIDGCPLRHWNVVNMLNVCMLQTIHRHLMILPHGLRSGGASQKCLDRLHILDIHHDCCWSEKGKAIDHYSHPNLIDLGPEKVYNERPCYRRQWKATKLIYLTQNIVETVGNETHKFIKCITWHFLETVKAIHSKLPRVFPAPTTKIRLIQLCQDWIQGWYIRWVVQQKKLNECHAEYKAKIRKAICDRNF